MPAHSFAELAEAVRNESVEGILLAENPHDNPICSLAHDQDLSCIKVVWRKYATSTQLRFLHEVILRMIECCGARNILGDDRELPVVHAEDQRWITEDWFPRARAVGLERVAAIPSHSFFGRVSIASVQLRLANKMPVKQFHSLNEAAEWLSHPR